MCVFVFFVGAHGSTKIFEDEKKFAALKKIEIRKEIKEWVEKIKKNYKG